MMVSIDDLSKRFAQPDGSLPGLYGVRCGESFNDATAGVLFTRGVPQRPLSGHAVRRLIAAGITVLAVWRVDREGRALAHEGCGPLSKRVAYLAKPAEFFEGDVMRGLPPKLVTVRKSKRKPKPPVGVFVMPKDAVLIEEIEAEEIEAAHAAKVLQVDAEGLGFVPGAWLAEHRAKVVATEVAPPTPPQAPAEPSGSTEVAPSPAEAPTEPLKA